MSKMLCLRHFVKPLLEPSHGNILPNLRFISTAVSRCQQSSSDCADQKIYELRIYNIKTKHIKEFHTITNEEFHLRTAHSKLLGYWNSEIGGLNQVVHIWEYDSLSHRTKVRANLANDPEWNSRYIGRVIGMFGEMNNSAMTLLPGVGIETPNEKGVYQLQTLNLNGNPSMWSQALVSYVKACKGLDLGTSKLIGAWRTFIGPKQMAALLWQHPGPDSCLTLQEATEGLSESIALSPYIADGHSRLLLPHAISPIQ